MADVFYGAIALDHQLSVQSVTNLTTFYGSITFMLAPLFLSQSLESVLLKSTFEANSKARPFIWGSPRKGKEGRLSIPSALLGLFPFRLFPHSLTHCELFIHWHITWLVCQESVAHWRPYPLILSHIPPIPRLGLCFFLQVIEDLSFTQVFRNFAMMCLDMGLFCLFVLLILRNVLYPFRYETSVFLPFWEVLLYLWNILLFAVLFEHL